MPVLANSGLLGSLDIAARRCPEAIVSQLPFLTHVARLLGAALERSRLRAAEAVLAQPFDLSVDAGENLRRVADQAAEDGISSPVQADSGR